MLITKGRDSMVITKSGMIVMTGDDVGSLIWDDAAQMSKNEITRKCHYRMITACLVIKTMIKDHHEEF